MVLLLPLSAFAQPPANPRPKIGVALEGGGALGLAHIGVLQWLEENKIPVDYIAGTSMGGLVGGLYATGMRPAEIQDFVSKIDWSDTLGGQIPFEALSFRRKEDKRAFQNNLEFGLKHGFSLPSSATSDKNITFLLDRQTLPYSQLSSFDDLPIPFRCIATDLVAGKPYVFKDGPLGDALRATMSLPGVFPPVARNGTLYADGGLMNNLPVDVVRQMGADIVIAVNLSVSPFDPQGAQSLVSILSRSISAMITVNERRSMELADIVISAQLEKYTGNDYEQHNSIISKGYTAAVSNSPDLAKLSVNDVAWQQHMATLDSRRIRSVATPEFVEIVGVDGPLARDIEKAFAGTAGEPVDTKQLEEKINQLSGYGRFYGFSYHMEEKNGRKGLILHPNEKEYAPPILNFGFLIDGADVGNVRFTANVRITALDVGGYRSEVRTDIAVGSTWGFATEYYKMLSPARNWFLAPRISASSIPFDLYNSEARIAEYRIRQAGGNLDLGYAFNRFSQLRMGYEAAYLDSALRVGSPVLATPAGRVGITSVKYEVNRLDSPVVPRTGEILRFRTQWTDAFPGASKAFPLSEISFGVMRRISRPGSAYIQGFGGTTYGKDETGLAQFYLGGLDRLAAYGRNEIRTNQYWLGRVGYVHELFSLPPILGDHVYATAAYEIAKAYNAPGVSRLPMDGAVALVIETLLGPLSVGASYGDTGHHRVYFSLGRFF